MNNSLPENFLQHRLLVQPTRADWLSDQSRYETKYFLKFSKISLISLQTPVSSISRVFKTTSSGLFSSYAVRLD